MNFYTFKWGKKYDHNYVNRLYGSLLCNVNIPFKFTCYTDDHLNFRDEIIVKNINELRPYNTDRVFTYEKLILLEKHQEGIWLDLDILIHENITDIVTRDDGDFKMIWNHWNNYETKSLRWYGSGSSCHINSSFVKFKNPEWLIKFTKDNWKKIEWTYKSLDKYMFYQHHRNNRLHYWEDGIFSNYNKEGFKLKDKITLFNTSHIKANNLKEIAYEIHEADGDVINLWKSYDT